MKKSFFIADTAAMVDMGTKFGKTLKRGDLVLLEGDLGARKTTFVRGVLRAFGWQGVVRSPTYTILESYDRLSVSIYHFDLYRLTGLEELELLGYRDYFRKDSIVLIEWPQRVPILADIATIKVNIDYAGIGRQVNVSLLSGAII